MDYSLFALTADALVSAQYDYNNFDAAEFVVDYNEIDKFEDVSLDLNEKFDYFLLNLHILVNKHCLKKTK